MLAFGPTHLFIVTTINSSPLGSGSVFIRNRNGSPVVIISRKIWLGFVGSFVAVMMASVPAIAQQQRKPNILVIMGDDVGWFNIGAYHQGIMSGKTPSLDKLAAEGMRFTD